MKETDTGVPRAGLALPAGIHELLQETQGAIGKRSQIVWGEHCTECAFPACYSSCSFYTPRADLHCRRFERGIERIDVPAVPVDLKRVQFRRWAKLEGESKVALKSRAEAAIWENLDRLADRLLSGPPSLRYRLAWRWNEAKRGLAGRGEPISARDVFILEAWQEGDTSWPYTFTVAPKLKSQTGLYQLRIEFGPGYNRLVIPASDILACVDLSQIVAVQIEPVGNGAPPVIFGMTDFARLACPLGSRKASVAPRGEPAVNRARQPKFKCVVWDLDNTLWHGTLAEDGIEGVRLSEKAAALVRELDRRGIINSIASKNDADLALAALEAFGLREYFVFPKIGWHPKSDSLKAVIADMDVGADTFAFIDDQAFERGEISALLPEVTVFSDQDLDRLLDDPRFDVPVTAESAKRRQMYQTEERRHAARAGSTMNYADFLRSCRIRLAIEPLSRENLSRIYELSQRTNQLNFSGRRYGMNELEQLAAERPQDTFVLACSDKFGDYGVIGFALLSATGSEVESFFLSCRVQRKLVENAFFQFLGGELCARNKRKLEVRYRKTAKNGAAARMLQDLGFDYRPESEEQGTFSTPLPPNFPDHDIVEIVACLPVPA